MRIAIFGNSGSGKSTLARELSHGGEIRVLDLDTIVWEPNQAAVRRPTGAVLADLHRFCSTHRSWIIEGCYGDLVAAALIYRPELIFMNPGEAACLRNCRSRPWEPHKYASPAEQDAHLAFLLEWVRDYYHRDGEMSLRAHRALFDAYDGPKREL
jgi:adenylate kinase family enzyme